MGGRIEGNENGANVGVIDCDRSLALRTANTYG